MICLNPLLAVAGIVLAICSFTVCFWSESQSGVRYSSETLDILLLAGTVIGTVVGLIGFFRSCKAMSGGRLVSVGGVLLLSAFAPPVVLAGAGVWNVHGCGLLVIIWSVGTGLTGVALAIRGFIRVWRVGGRGAN